jgi:hypothetical protein
LFGEKFAWYFSSVLFPTKTDRKKTLKIASDSAVLSKYGEILEQIIEQSTWKSRDI